MTVISSSEGGCCSIDDFSSAVVLDEEFDADGDGVVDDGTAVQPAPVNNTRLSNREGKKKEFFIMRNETEMLKITVYEV